MSGGTLLSEGLRSRTSRRARRLQVYGLFLSDVKSCFAEIAAADPRHADFNQIYRLCLVPGGTMGGVDDRLFDVFYGSRPFDSVTEIVPGEATPFGRRQCRTLREWGARLEYLRMDNGMVLCCLHPARSENIEPLEQRLILGWIDPAALTGRGTLERHWRAFMSYMECTCLEGEPTLGDRLRVGWLRFTRSRVLGGKHERPRWITMGGWTLWFASTVGLSGFVLELVKRAFGAP